MANYGNRERLTNGATSNLAAAMNDSQTSLQVDDGSSFPTNGNFRIRIDDEIIYVIGNSLNVFTIERGTEGTTAAAHADNSVVYLVYTEDGLERYFRDDDEYSNSSRPPLGRIVDASGNVLTSADFTPTGVTTGGVGMADQNGTIVINMPARGGVNSVYAALRTKPSTPMALVAAVRVNQPMNNAANYYLGGICFWSTASFPFRFAALCVRPQDQIVIYFNDDDNDFSTTYSQTIPYLDLGEYVWLKMADDGTNHLYSISHDGINWIQVYSQSRTNYLTTDGGTQMGLFANSGIGSGTSLPTDTTFVHYDEGASP